MSMILPTFYAVNWPEDRRAILRPDEVFPALSGERAAIAPCGCYFIVQETRANIRWEQCQAHRVTVIDEGYIKPTSITFF